MSTTTCRAEYVRPGGRERGDRIVRCHLPAGHPSAHEEADTEITWTEGTNVAEYIPDPADVELVMQAIRNAPVSIRDGYVDGAGQLAAEARAVLAALTAAGRLRQGDDMSKEIRIELSGASHVTKIPDHQDTPGTAPYFCPTSGGVECPEHGGFDVCCDATERHRPTPAPVPPAALDAAIEAVKATQWATFKAGDNWTSLAAGTPEEIAGAVLTAVAPILLAAGRRQAAADIRQKINAANTSLYVLDVLSLAAEIAEGKTDA